MPIFFKKIQQYLVKVTQFVFNTALDILAVVAKGFSLLVLPDNLPASRANPHEGEPKTDRLQCMRVPSINMDLRLRAALMSSVVQKTRLLLKAVYHYNYKAFYKKLSALGD